MSDVRVDEDGLVVRSDEGTNVMTSNDTLQHDKTRTRALFRSFCLLTLMLVAAIVARGYITGGDTLAIPMTSLGILGVMVAGIALLVVQLPRPTFMRRLLLAAVAYHALFAPAFLVHVLVNDATRSDDLVIRAYPHVVEFIDSFE